MSYPQEKLKEFDEQIIPRIGARLQEYYSSREYERPDIEAMEDIQIVKSFISSIFSSLAQKVGEMDDNLEVNYEEDNFDAGQRMAFHKVLDLLNTTEDEKN